MNKRAKDLLQHILTAKNIGKSDEYCIRAIEDEFENQIAQSKIEHLRKINFRLDRECMRLKVLNRKLKTENACLRKLLKKVTPQMDRELYREITEELY